MLGAELLFLGGELAALHVEELGTEQAGTVAVLYVEGTQITNALQVDRNLQGVPIGGELDYLDDGTLTAALKSRREV
mgnify:CR=1 FL=1